MTYKKFLQALANAYKSTADQIGNQDAFMCLVLDCKNSDLLYERIVMKASGMLGNEETKIYSRRLKDKIYAIEHGYEGPWREWANQEFPDIPTNHLRRAHWLQIQADNA